MLFNRRCREGTFGADKRLVLKKGVNQNNGICNYSYSTGWMLSGGQAKEALIASGLFAIAGAISFKK